MSVALVNETVERAKAASANGNSNRGTGGDSAVGTAGDGASSDDPLVAMLQQFANFAVAHRDVIAKWGRFPHRNETVGRQSTPEELAGLQDGSIPKW